MTSDVSRHERWRARRRSAIEFVRFSAVGCSGIVVNLGIYYVLTRIAAVPIEMASPIAIELSILWNFALNDVWTFGGRRTDGGLPVRVVRFHAVSLVAGALNYAILIALARAGWWDIYANFVGIGVAAVAKFGVNAKWTWRERGADYQRSPLAVPEGRR
jgi:dolichol-phosphate mannosyltransferase